ncbi:hypothetical protein [Pedobacter westerhofensis]|uniref:hypothetical protein n=1 Tax=Pedobacter westerhofensis TaxID=425512 RepID=UPI001FE9CEBC|nr:hypothetical protein [Pedobacter westerhofensis]
MVPAIDIMFAMVKFLLIGKPEKDTAENTAEQAVQGPQAVQEAIPCRPFRCYIIEGIKSYKKTQNDKEKIKVVYSL